MTDYDIELMEESIATVRERAACAKTTHDRNTLEGAADSAQRVLDAAKRSFFTDGELKLLNSMRPKLENEIDLVGVMGGSTVSVSQKLADFDALVRKRTKP